MFSKTEFHLNKRAKWKNLSRSTISIAFMIYQVIMRHFLFNGSLVSTSHIMTVVCSFSIKDTASNHTKLPENMNISVSWLFFGLFGQ